MNFSKEDFDMAGEFLGSKISGSEILSSVLTENGQRTLVRCLTARLLNLYWPLLWRGMRIDVESVFPVALSMPALMPADLRFRLMRRAFETLMESGKECLWAAYPELKRREQVIRRGFDRFAEELFLCIEQKRDEIIDTFFHGADFGKITAVHHLGINTVPRSRMTVRIETEAGAFYFKPRNCGTESFYRDLARKFFPEMSTGARIIAGNNYAFMESIGKQTLRTFEELREYYRHLGYITAVFFALQSHDMHAMNFIAQGIYPVPIDLEFLVTTRTKQNAPRHVSDTLVIYNDERKLLSSVLYKDSISYMRLEDGEEQVHIPELNGEAMSVFEVENDYTEGFTEGYRAIMAHKKEWMSFIREYPDMPVRIILRDLRYYKGIFTALHKPERLSSIETRDAYLEEICKGFPSEMDNLLRVVERNALLNEDIPYLYMKAGEPHLYDHTGEIRIAHWHKSPFDCIRDSLNEMSEEELAHCASEIRGNIKMAKRLKENRKSRNRK